MAARRTGGEREPAISIAEARHVASLARLGVSDETAAALARELNSILEHMAVLRSIDTDGIDEASGVGAAGMHLREDAGPPLPLADAPEAFAPAMRAGFFLVPRLASHEAVAEGGEVSGAMERE